MEQVESERQRKRKRKRREIESKRVKGRSASKDGQQTNQREIEKEGDRAT